MTTNRFTGTPRRQTYAEAVRDNWPAYTCVHCYGPRRWDRDGLCESCVKNIADGILGKLITVKKERAQ